MTARTFGDWLKDLRDRLVGDARVRRFVARFPPTRPIARRKARNAFDLVAGFVYSQVLLACVQLDLFRFVAGHPRDIPELAAHCRMGESAITRLVDAAIALGLLDRRSGGRIGLGETGAAIAGDPGIVAMIAHHAMLYEDLADPVALLRGEPAETRISRYWAYARSGAPADLAPGDVAPYSTLMSLSQSLIAEEVLDAYDIRRHRHLMDVGGGEGTFLAAALARAPRLQGTLFDLPPVAQRAADRLRTAGFGDRAGAVGGSFFDDALPTGADVISLVRVLYDHDDPAAAAILAAVRRALPTGGTLLVAEPMAGTRGALPMGDAYFGFYLLAMRSGRARTPATLMAMLAAAGFARSKLVSTRLPVQTRLIVARA